MHRQFPPPASIFDLYGDAYAFLIKLRGSREPRALMSRAIDTILDRSKPLRISQVSAAFVAAEVVAALRGAQTEEFLYLTLRGSIAEQGESIVTLWDAAANGLAAVIEKGRTWRDSADPATLERLAGELLARLDQPANMAQVGAIVTSGRQKPVAGSVFRLPLGQGRSAFGRVYRKSYFYVYAVMASSTEPPIGSRDFLFYTSPTTSLRDLIGTGLCPIVGRDPFKAGERRVPAVYNGPRMRTTIWELPGSPVASPFQCVGMERLGWDSFAGVVERIRAGETSLQRSIREFGSLLSADDLERGLEALQGRVVRHFDDAENRRFGLEPPIPSP